MTLAERGRPEHPSPFLCNLGDMNLMEHEQEVVERAKVDPSAFGQLYDMYYQPIFGYLLKRTGNAEIAKDIASETFFQALKNLHRYKDRGKPFKSWLFAIAVAQVGNYFRKRSKFLEVTTDVCPEIVGNELLRPDVALHMSEQEREMKHQVELLCKLLNELKPVQKDVITLRYFSQLSIKEIAQTLDLKEGTVKSHIHRSIKRLEELLSEELKEQPYVSELTTQYRHIAPAAGLS